MPFRLYFFGIIAFIVVVGVFFLGVAFVPAQTTTDFAPWKDAKNAENIPDWVRLMLTRDFRNVTGTDRDELLANTLEALVEIISDPNVVPATRYNAILAAGQLEVSPGNPSTAYPAALEYLANVYQRADAPYYLKYGALLGIVRHALLGIDPAYRDKVVVLLLETAAMEFVAGHADMLEPATWNWFRQTALDGLSAVKTTGMDGIVVSELLHVINRQSQKLESLFDGQDIFLRETWKQTCETIELASKVAKTLGDLDYQPASDVDAQEMTDSFIRLTKVVCDVMHKMAADFIELEKTTPDPAILSERIVVNIKICTQSVVWGIRSGFLTTSKSGENSFYASLKSDDPSLKRLDVLMSEIVELSNFFDEGDKAKRTIAIPNMPKAFKFDILELRDFLKKCSDALMKIQGHL